MNIGGEVQETFRSETRVAFEWCLQDLFSMSEENFFQVISPVVTLQGAHFVLVLTPNGFCGNRNTILIGLLIYNSVQVKRFRFSLGHKKANGDERELCREEELDVTDPSMEHSSIFKILKKSDLQSRKDELAPSDVVTFTCKIWNSGSPDFNRNEVPQAKKRKRTEGQGDHSNIEDYSTLSQNLRNLLLQGDNHDVVLKLKNKEYKAHKIILGARSPVFAAMFRHEMVEAANNSVTIDDCDPVAFSEFLLYVYSGELVNTISPSLALHLNYIADKYDVSMLKERCITFFETSLSASNVCDSLDLAEKLNNGEFYQRAIAFFAENLQEVLKSEKWKQCLIADSLQANKILEEAAAVLSKK